MFYPWSDFKPSEGLFFFYAVVLDESYPLIARIRSHPIRLFFPLYIFGFYTLTMGYRGSLMSFLTVKIDTPPMNTIQELVDSGMRIGSVTDFFKAAMVDSSNPYLNSLKDLYKANGNLTFGMEQLGQRKLALTESRGTLVYNQRKKFTNKVGRTSVHIMSDCYLTFHVAFLVAKNSKYTEIFNRRIQQLTEAGLIELYNKQEMDKVATVRNGGKGDNSNAKPEPLNMSQLQGPFYVWLFLQLASILAFLIETFWSLSVIKSFLFGRL